VSPWYLPRSVALEQNQDVLEMCRSKSITVGRMALLLRLYRLRNHHNLSERRSFSLVLVNISEGVWEIVCVDTYLLPFLESYRNPDQRPIQRWVGTDSKKRE
jgi:hypothetical protein